MFDEDGCGYYVSSVWCYFCGCCGSVLWFWDLIWLDLVYLYVSVIDMLLLWLLLYVYCMVGFKVLWVDVEGKFGDLCFDIYLD